MLQLLGSVETVTWMSLGGDGMRVVPGQVPEPTTSQKFRKESKFLSRMSSSMSRDNLDDGMTQDVSESRFIDCISCAWLFKSKPDDKVGEP